MRADDVRRGCTYKFDKQADQNAGVKLPFNAVCVKEVKKTGGYYSRTENAQYRILNDDGSFGKKFECWGHRGVAYVKGASLSERQLRAQELRFDVADKKRSVEEIDQSIRGMEANKTKLLQEIDDIDGRIVALEEYESDEEALAHRLSEIMRTGGDVDAIASILKRDTTNIL